MIRCLVICKVFSLSEKIAMNTIDNQFDFEEQASDICNTNDQKLNDLFRVSPFSITVYLISVLFLSSYLQLQTNTKKKLKYNESLTFAFYT